MPPMGAFWSRSTPSGVTMRRISATIRVASARLFGPTRSTEIAHHAVPAIASTAATITLYRFRTLNSQFALAPLDAAQQFLQILLFPRVDASHDRHHGAAYVVGVHNVSSNQAAARSAARFTYSGRS
jgi:hypothetical protein